MYTGPVIDTHTHPLINEKQRLAVFEHTAQDYADKADGTGVSKAAALTIAQEGELTETAKDNDAVLRLAEQFNGFYFPVCSVHPRDGRAATAELDRVAQAGAKWLKLHPNTQQFDVSDDVVVDIVRRAGELGMPILFDAYSPFDPAQPGKFIELAMTCQDSTLILAHAHGPNFSALLAYHMLAKYPWWKRNVYIDVSVAAPTFADGPYAEQFVWILRKVGIDRILFGSDFPLYSPIEALDAVGSLGFTDQEQAQILHDNAATLLE
ncbi:MAG TPA: amidohydrolase family protein [Pseudonocardiaceae bacterium]